METNIASMVSFGKTLVSIETVFAVSETKALHSRLMVSFCKLLVSIETLFTVLETKIFHFCLTVSFGRFLVSIETIFAVLETNTASMLSFAKTLVSIETIFAVLETNTLSRPKSYPNPLPPTLIHEKSSGPSDHCFLFSCKYSISLRF